MSFYYNPPPVLITNTNVNSFAETACGTGYVGFFHWLRNFLDENIENYDFVITTYPSLFTTDWFHKFRNKRPIFCIDATSSKLENDKLFTKQMLTDIGIPTPKFKNLLFALTKPYSLTRLLQLKPKCPDFVKFN